MNTSDENTEPTAIDEYHDRLIDRGLAELLGNETPPDLLGPHSCCHHGNQARRGRSDEAQSQCQITLDRGSRSRRH